MSFNRGSETPCCKLMRSATWAKDNSQVLRIRYARWAYRWVQSGNEALPRDRAQWLERLADFVVVYPWMSAEELLDDDKGDIDSTHWLTCRQCRRKEKGPAAPPSSYETSKLTDSWPPAIIFTEFPDGGDTFAQWA